nr:acyl-CoA dehydrogenase family protein [uncultured Bacillus sp.]
MTNKQADQTSFLFIETDAEDLFVPEKLTEEHKMMGDMAEKFIATQVKPLMDQIEQGRLDLNVTLLKQAGQLGLLGLDISEKYGGIKLDKISSTLLTEKIAFGRSFAVTHGGQVGIGSLPIVYFGTKKQKQTYLPGVASGEKIGAYALTEPAAGTDALSVRTTAMLSDCGKYYILNGEKQFITNSGYADFFIVFAKINREHFTAFIVDRHSEGLTTGAEEKKMGLKGSSTRPVILDHVKVPIENVLGEIGKGHVIAFNILNIGRHKISATCLGNSKQAFALAVDYSKERSQFARPIAEFPLIQEKIADMSVLNYINESMIYRTAHLLDLALEGIDDDGNRIGRAISRYAAECSINKVFSTEALDFIVDEALQIHGGYGFVSEYEIETLYRDSRINRIFEGTNEINRMVIASNLFNQMEQNEEITFSAELNAESELYQERKTLRLAKSSLLQSMSLIKKSISDFNQEQELLRIIADTAIDIYAMESAILRTEKIYRMKGVERERQKALCTKVFVHEAGQRISARMMNILLYLDETVNEKVLVENIMTLYQGNRINLIKTKRMIAEDVIG